MKEQKMNKSELVTKFVGIIVAIIFMKKISLKFFVKFFLHGVFLLITWVEAQNLEQNNLMSNLSNSLPTKSTLVEELSKCYDYFFRLSGLPDLFDKVFLITFKFS